MRIIEKLLHWVFALFMAIVAWVLTLGAGAVLMLKLVGLPIGAKPPPDFQPWIGNTAFMYVTVAMMLAPLVVATFVGAMTAPFTQRGIAAIAFPVLMFAGFTALMLRGDVHYGSFLIIHLEAAACCAAPGVFVYFRSRRHRVRRAGA